MMVDKRSNRQKDRQINIQTEREREKEGMYRCRPKGYDSETVRRDRYLKWIDKPMMYRQTYITKVKQIDG